MARPGLGCAALALVLTGACDEGEIRSRWDAAVTDGAVDTGLQFVDSAPPSTR